MCQMKTGPMPCARIVLSSVGSQRESIRFYIQSVFCVVWAVSPSLVPVAVHSVFCVVWAVFQPGTCGRSQRVLCGVGSVPAWYLWPFTACSVWCGQCSSLVPVAVHSVFCVVWAVSPSLLPVAVHSVFCVVWAVSPSLVPVAVHSVFCVVWAVSFSLLPVAAAALGPVLQPEVSTAPCGVILLHFSATRFPLSSPLWVDLIAFGKV